MRQYRERMTEEHRKAALEKDRLRKKESRAKRSFEQKKIDSTRYYERVKKSRAEKKLLQSSTSCSSKHSPQVIGKAIKKVLSSLPKSPTKKVDVIEKLAHMTGLEIQTHIKPSQTARPNAISPETIALVNTFYESVDISQEAPGRKDYIIIRKDGQKHKIQKKYMYMTISEAHELFKKSNPTVKIGLSKFSNLRPKHILPSSQTPANVCVCQIHANVDLVLKGLKSAKIAFPEKAREVVERLMCDIRSDQCMTNNCPILVQIYRLLSVSFVNLDTGVPEIILNEDNVCEQMKWYQWEKTGENNRVSKVMYEGTVSDGIDVLKKLLPKFFFHCYIKDKQAEYYAKLKVLIKHDPTRALVQADFAENYTIAYQDEVQSAHWTNDQVTIFTVVIWHQDIVKLYAVCSDYMQHDKYAVHIFLQNVVKDFVFLYPTVHEIDIFSDGAGQHFKQKFNLCNVSFMEEDIGVRAAWHFFATSHGKGPVDGIGGQLKHHVWVETKARRYIVNDIESFVRCAEAVCKKTVVIFIPKSKFLAAVNKLEERWIGIHAIPSTHSVHCIKAEGKYCIKYSVVSNSHLMTSFNFQTGISENSETELETTRNQEPATFGKWVLVELKSEKKKFHHFVGQVTEVFDSPSANISLKFLKKVGEKFVLSPNDVSVISKEEIISLLPEPSFDNRGRLSFEHNFTDYNLK